MSKPKFAWRTQEDVINDLWEYSELGGVGQRNSNEPTPPTILEYRARMAANNRGSIFDNPEVDDGVTHIISGRGRGTISIILKPGVSALSDQQVEDDVRRRIRQVSGLGYSNAMIEQHYKDVMAAKEEGIPKRTTSNTPSQPEKERCSSSCSSSSSSSHLASSESAAPLPLSVMRKKAEDEWKKKKKLEAKQRDDDEKTFEDALESETNDKENSTSDKLGLESPKLSERYVGDCGYRWGTNNASSWGRGKSSPRRNHNGFTLKDEDFPSLK